MSPPTRRSCQRLPALVVARIKDAKVNHQGCNRLTSFLLTSFDHRRLGNASKPGRTRRPSVGHDARKHGCRSDWPFSNGLLTRPQWQYFVNSTKLGQCLAEIWIESGFCSIAVGNTGDSAGPSASVSPHASVILNSSASVNAHAGKGLHRRGLATGLREASQQVVLSC